MPDEPRGIARLPLQLSQERSVLQQTLLGSIKLFKGDVLRFAHDWQARWTNPAITGQLAEISEALLTDLGGLEQELSRPEGPASVQVAGLLAMLLGGPGVAGPLARLQQLAEDEAPGLSLEKQRLLSEVDTLFIQLNGFRAQWQDYLSLLPASGRAASSDPTEPLLPPLPPNQRARRATAPLPPLRRPIPPPYAPAYAPPPPVSAPPRAGQGGGLGDMLKALLPILLALVVIVFVAVEVVSRAPKSTGQTTPGSVPSVTYPTQPAQPTSTSAPASTLTPSPQPASAQLSVSPSSLQLPCPASGASQLQIANTGGAAFDWQAAAASTAGDGPGILLDGDNPDSGHLNPGEVTQISVTAQAATAQGTITITATGGASQVTVPYSVNC